MTQSGNEKKIPVAISYCLLGAPVRYDGKDKLDSEIVETLGDIFEWEPVCPEVLAGLGVPREPVGLRRFGKLTLVIGKESGKDYTNAIKNNAISKLRKLSHVRGFILTGKSPSCGIKNAQVTCENGDVENDGYGVFAQAVEEIMPDTPKQSSERLCDPKLRKEFIDRIINLAK